MVKVSFYITWRAYRFLDQKYGSRVALYVSETESSLHISEQSGFVARFQTLIELDLDAERAEP